MTRISGNNPLNGADLLGLARTQRAERAKEAKRQSRAIESLQRSGYSIDRMRMYATQEANKFISANRDLLYVADHSDEVRQALQKKTVATRDDLKQVLADVAAGQLTGAAATKLTANVLKDDPTLSAQIILNTGGLRDILNRDGSQAELFTANSASPEKALYAEVGKKAAALFSSSNPLNDADFMTQHPKVATYLLSRPDVVQKLNGLSTSVASAKAFKERVDNSAYQSMFDSFVTSFATTAVNSGSFPSSFFSATEHIKFAEYVTAGEFQSNVPKPSEYLKKHPEIRGNNLAAADNFDFTNVVKEITAGQATGLLPADSPMTQDFLQSHSGVASLVIQNSSYRTNISSTRASIDLSAVLQSSEYQPSISSTTQDLVRRQFQSIYAEPQRNVSIVV